MFPPLSKSAIQQQLGSTFYGRGRGYARGGRVLGLEVSETEFGWWVRGRVGGGAVYTQDIHLLEYDGALTIEGECSCPVGYNCKHVAAVLIALVERPATDRQQPSTGPYVAWLERLAEAAAPDSWPVERGAQTLIYLLRPVDGRPWALDVEVALVRLLKRGEGYGKPRQLYSYDLLQAAYAPYAQPADRQILPLLDVAAGSSYRSARLDGMSGALALRQMAQTGRLYCRSVQRAPLQWDSARPLTAVWQAEGDFLRLHLDTDPAGGRVLPLDPPMYLDEARGTLGPLRDVTLSQRQLAALLEAPRLPAAEAGRVSAELVARFPQLDLPLPQALRQVRVTEPLVPVLSLGAPPPGAMGEAALQAVGLVFAYAGHRLGPPVAGDSRLVQDDTVIEIVRDADAERAALARLAACGFRPLAAGDARLFTIEAADRLTAARRWQTFLEQEVPRLEADGWQVERDPAFRMDFLPLPEIEALVDDQGGWFDLQLGVEIDGRRLDLVPVLAELVARIDSPDALGDDEKLLVELDDARWLSLPARRIKPLVATLFELFGGELAEREALRLNRMDAAQLEGLDEAVDHWQGGEALRALGQRLRDLSGIPKVAPPAGLHAELRDYQRRGLDWLQFLRQTGFGGILADDMGLGKTLQTLAHLLLEKEAGRLDRPALIVAPTSLMANWRHEAARFTPALSLLTLHGPQRGARFAEIARHDLVLTTYPLLPRDQDALLTQRFHSLILDEAQTIKNPRAKAAQVARRLQAEHRLCLTGTPMENHLGELWSLFHFLAPGYLGDERQFRRLFRVPIEVHDDALRRQALKRRIAPFLLRRTKQQVAAELPEKTIIVRSVALEGPQADLYESVRASMDRKVRDSLSRKGLARSQITILDALLKLRQICCDPRLLRLEQARRSGHSAKLELLMQMLPELLEEGRRVLLFSQFTSMLKLIEERLDALGIVYSKLTGQTRKREQAIARFRGREVPLFLISLKAGGVGLNLTEADTVIHYDPWWNPAVEEQATDRAHRIGQTSKVFVYKLVTDNTVEEKILALQARKAALAGGLFKEGAGGGAPQFDEEDLRELLRPIE